MVLGALPGVSSPVSAYSTHAPILINDDSGFTAGNGVVSGDGSESDPYLIEGWEIQAPGGNAIEIRGTSSYFVIRDVLVYSSIYGIYLNYSSNGLIESSVLFDNDYSVIALGSSGTVIRDNNVTAHYVAIEIAYADSCLVTGNSASIDDEGAAIAAGLSNESVIEGNNISGDRGQGIEVDWCNGLIVRGNTVGASGCLVQYSTNCSFWENELTLSGFGVHGDLPIELDSLEIAPNNTANDKPVHYLADIHGGSFGMVEAGQVIVADCSDLTLFNLTVGNITNSWEPGYTGAVECLMSSNVTFRNITLENNAVGVLVESSTGTLIETCDFIGVNYQGVSLESANHTTIKGISGGGVTIYSSSDTTIRNGTRCGVGMSWSDGCTVDGVTESPGFSASQSTDILVSNSSFVPNGESDYMQVGIYLGAASRCLISNCSIQGFDRGIEIQRCSEVRVLGNRLQENNELGIMLGDSDDCLFDHNQFIANEVSGLDLLDFSDNVTVTWNSFVGNNYGIYFSYETDSRVHHNDFIGNSANAYTAIVVPSNLWDDGYPSGGNYWSDYTGEDLNSGPAQDVPGSDGVGDSAYLVRGGGYQDRYPFMAPLLGPINHPPVALLEVDPGTGTIDTVFMMNASGSYDVEDIASELRFRWDFGWDDSPDWDDTAWDTDWTTNSTAEWKFSEPGLHIVRVQVRDSDFALSQAEYYLSLVNFDPVASFSAMPPSGDLMSVFEFNATSSYDHEDPSDSLMVRWDFDQDGVWEVNWTTDKSAVFQYSASGAYTVTLEVMDTVGAVNSTQMVVVVTAVIPEFGSVTLPVVSITAMLVAGIWLRRRTLGRP
jgi:parallel beta-helix repeat protein